ncbi:zinc finger CCCH domain-containing protein 41, partial [Tanacetum coccineum]
MILLYQRDFDPLVSQILSKPIFGEVIAIHIPLNSKQAFVKFSKTEEAKAALLAPDVVM